MSGRRDDGGWILRVAPFATGGLAIVLIGLGVYSLVDIGNVLLATICFVFAAFAGVSTIGNLAVKKQTSEDDHRRAERRAARCDAQRPAPDLGER